MDKEDETQVKSQGVILDTIVIKSVEAIIGYIAIWLFKPVWRKIIGLWNTKNETDSETD
jgi:hypothetical protein